MTAPHPEAALSAREVLSSVLDEYDRNICAHEETYRGGSIWTICHQCGSKWADDQGGFQPHVDPPAIARARKIVCDASTAHTATAGDEGERTWHRDGALLYTLKPHVNQFGRSRGKLVNDVTVRVEGPDAETIASEIHARLVQAPAVQAPAGEDVLPAIGFGTTTAQQEAFRQLHFPHVTPTDAQPKAARPEGDEALREALDRAVSTLTWIRDAGGPNHQKGSATRPQMREAAQDALDSIASHPTTGQETVATPREDGVRGARPSDDLLFATLARAEKEQIASGNLADKFIWQTAAWALRSALSAPGSAGPGETRNLAEQFRQKAAESRLKACGDLLPHVQQRCFGAAAAYEEAARLATPSPAQEPGTGDTGEAEHGGFGDGRRICEALGFDPANHHNALKCPYCNPNQLRFATPATTAETRGPAGQTKGGL